MKNLRWNFFITGGILILLGVLTLRYPIEAIMSAGFMIGLGLTASGLNYFSGFYFFRLKRFIVLGLLDLISGIIMIVQPGISAFLFPFVLAAWLLSNGLARTCTGFWLGGAEVKGWWVVLLDGLMLICFALFVCASPLLSSLSVMMIIGCVLIVSGVMAIGEGLSLRV